MEMPKVGRSGKMKTDLRSEVKVKKNKTESIIAFEDRMIMNRANSLCCNELLGDAEMMNIEINRYQQERLKT